jgi:DNA polymerase
VTLHIHGDWETRSEVDIQKAGADVYAEHPSTEILTFSYAFGDGPVRRWKPGDPLPEELFLELAMGAKFVGHNVYFELVIWKHIAAKRYGFPPLRANQCIDTMAICYAHALPGALAGAAKAVGLSVDKDEAGRRVMLKLCRPRGYTEDGKPIWYERADYPEMFAILDAYCDQDVVVERALEKRLPALKASEQALWELDFEINQRGVPIDIESAERALAVIDEEARVRNAELRQITGGAVPSATAVQKFVRWLHDVKGLEVHSLTKADVRELLARKDLAADVRTALEIRNQVGKTSTKKLKAMMVATSADGRARGLHQFHSAGTGRWGGRRIQTQNMVRPDKNIDVEWCLNVLKFEQPEAFAAIDLVYGGATAPLSSCMRAMIAAKPGNRFLTADFSNVEGRVLPWLAGEQWKLDMFAAIDRGEGKDPYLVSASGIFNEEINDKEDPRRQAGKVSELALGYQGGAGAFASMANNLGVDVEAMLPPVWQVSSFDRKKEALRSWWARGRQRGDMSRAAWVAAELVKMPWRDKHPAVVQFWRDIEDAAIEAIANPGLITRVGQYIRFRKAGSFLFMQLPSGRCLAYAFPKLMWRPMPWKDPNTGKQALKQVMTFFCRIDESKKAKIVKDPANGSKWARVATYGGELTENAVQAVSRDLLACAMFLLEEHGYCIVMHVHDEAVSELPDGVGTLDEMLILMAVVPPWAAGLPMHAAGWEGVRYRK